MNDRLFGYEAESATGNYTVAELRAMHEYGFALSIRQRRVTGVRLYAHALGHVLLAIVGSRNFVWAAGIQQVVKTIPQHVIVCSGDVKGVDTLAIDMAKKRGLRTIILPAQWDLHGRSAGAIRNHELVTMADYVIAFWDGESRGTEHRIRLARLQAKLLTVISDRDESLRSYDDYVKGK